MVHSDFSPLPTTKAALRRHFLKLRQTLSIADWQHQSQSLCEQLQQAEWWQRSQTILAYCSTRQEPDLSFLFTLPKTWGLPRCVGSKLIWHEWSPTTDLPLQSGTFGILEPHPDSPRLTAAEVDLILVPAIACDHRGYRLGYGGGFYDRLLSASEWAEKPTVGIVFEQAVVAQLPSDEWDKPLQAVCTEAKFRVF